MQPASVRSSLPLGAQVVSLGEVLARADHDHGVPHYLSKYYWWAYIHPNAVRFFDRDWVINFILWGNYRRLADVALAELGDDLPGRTLQVACAYGNLTSRLARQVQASGGHLDVVDVLPIQLENSRKKMPAGADVRFLLMDSADLKLTDGAYDRALIYFLLHEQPDDYRERTIGEVMRVVKPGGKIVFIDYAMPRWWNPFRYFFRPVLNLLEPFALALWKNDFATWLPAGFKNRITHRARYFGGLYQKVVISR
jgi:ubiquinone/menaquinone biosynthesis C-methylase UbiE